MFQKLTATLAFCLLATATHLAFAFGISTPYWNANPLLMVPGEKKEVLFNLQNCPWLGPECERRDVEVVAEMVAGREIAKIPGNGRYVIPFGTADTWIKMKVKIPPKANPGDTYLVVFTVGEILPPSGGGIGIAIQYTMDFPVIVVAPPGE